MVCMQCAAVLDGFRDVRCFDVGAACQVCNGSGYAQDAVEAPGTPAELGGDIL